LTVNTQIIDQTWIQG